MVLIQNSTYALAQIYDVNLNKLSVTNLTSPVTITFTMPASVLQQYKSGLMQLQCASRDSFSQAWSASAISLISVNSITGDVICSATHFT